MDFNEADAGKFRANPDANVKNNIKLVDPNTPGTIEQDNVTIDITAKTDMTGVNYIAKDGVVAFYPFQKTLTPYGS